MEDLIEKLTALFEDNYPGCRCELYERLGTHVGGFLISDQFEEKPMEDRQREVWKLLREKLTHEEILAITGIFTQTENEYAIMLEESEAV